MSWYDRTPEQRECDRLPRFLVRPPAPEPLSGNPTAAERRAYSERRYAWERSWEVHLDVPKGGFGRLVRNGWEVRPAHAGRRLDFDQTEEQRRDEIDRWADGLINDTGTPGLIWPEDREAVLTEVARRLREATADGFLLRALQASGSVGHRGAT
jgi:hypothetical protein